MYMEMTAEDWFMIGVLSFVCILIVTLCFLSRRQIKHYSFEEETDAINKAIANHRKKQEDIEREIVEWKNYKKARGRVFISENPLQTNKNCEDKEKKHKNSSKK